MNALVRVRGILAPGLTAILLLPVPAFAAIDWSFANWNAPLGSSWMVSGNGTDTVTIVPSPTTEAAGTFTIQGNIVMGQTPNSTDTITPTISGLSQLSSSSLVTYAVTIAGTSSTFTPTNQFTGSGPLAPQTGTGVTITNPNPMFNATFTIQITFTFAGSWSSAATASSPITVFFNAT
jgi:hypothetical protein